MLLHEIIKFLSIRSLLPQMQTKQPVTLLKWTQTAVKQCILLALLYFLFICFTMQRKFQSCVIDSIDICSTFKSSWLGVRHNTQAFHNSHNVLFLTKPKFSLAQYFSQNYLRFT